MNSTKTASQRPNPEGASRNLASISPFFIVKGFLGLSVSFERKETMEWFGRRMNYWIEPSSRYTFWQAKKTG
jgi:hypothetical protein